MGSTRFKTLQTGSTGTVANDGRMTATSASRNVDVIIDVLEPRIPKKGCALEIASGTGQHIAKFAEQFPNVIWQPSDLDPVKIKSIDSWAAKTDLNNLLNPITLDATTSGWAANHSSFDLIVVINLLHLISVSETQKLIDEASKALVSGGLIFIYGPFMRGNRFASDGDEQFHHSLSTQDPDIGYKSFESIQSLQTKAGLSIQTPQEMPANNLVLCAIK